jgi:hypothetical protein
MNIDPNKRNRETLKSYFVRNAIPTEAQFAQLMDSMLNQREDGLVKTPNGPLSIEAAGPAAGARPVLDFYDSIAEAQPTFSLALRATPGQPRRALAVLDGAGAARLSVDADTGNVGVGVAAPAERLQVDGRVRAGPLAIGPWPSNPAGYAFLGSALLDQNAAGNYALLVGTGMDAGVTFLNSPTQIALRIGNTDRARLTSDGRLGIGTTAPAETLHVEGRARAGALALGPWPPNPGGYGFVGSALLDQNAQGNYALLVGTGADAGVTFLNSPSYITLRTGNTDRARLTNDGRLGIGTASPRARLEVADGAIMPAAGDSEQAGILFPPDAFGGAGDRAWIRWLRRGGSGENTTLEIGVGNDAEDHIALMPSGNVGIGLRDPSARLHVNGPLRAANLFGGRAFRTASGQTRPQDWAAYATNQGIVVTVDTSSAGFENTPRYFTALHGNSLHWDTVGATSIYEASRTGFKVYLRWRDASPMQVAQAVNNGWFIAWFAVDTDDTLVFNPRFDTDVTRITPIVR